MEKKEIEDQMLGVYPDFIKNLNRLIDICLSKVTDISKSKGDWIKNNDERYTIYGKYVSVLNATRISLYISFDFLLKEDWTEIYNSEFAIPKGNGNFIYLKELDTHYRFASYMSFVSKFESSILTIIRSLLSNGETCDKKYAGFIKNQLKLNGWNDFLEIVTHLRNSIHNNGLHIPDNNSKDNVSISFKNLKFDFNVNKRVELNWNECFIIYENLIELTEVIHNQSLIEKQNLIADMVMNS